MKCEKCNQEIPDESKEEFVEIKHKDTGTVLIKVKGANLQGANLRGADLQYANLQGAKTKMCTVNFTSREIKQAKQFAEGLDK